MWGFADLHCHPMAHLGFGGTLFAGRPEGPIGAALAHCDDAHGVGGTGVGGTTSVLLGGIEGTGYGLGIGHLVGGNPEFDGWPRFTSAIHQQMYVDWLRRAYDGGLRLMVALAVNAQMLARFFGDHHPYDDNTVVERQVQAMKAFVGRHSAWMEIAYTPADARRIVGANKLAVVLGIEVDSLGNWRRETDCTEAEVFAYLRHIHDDLGVRHVFPIHLTNNTFGGAAVYHDLFAVSNRFMTGDYFRVEDASRSGIEFRLGEDSSAAVAAAPLLADYHPPDYRAVPGGHANMLGLTPRGRYLIEQMMQFGMLIDIDHMSQRAVDMTLDLAERSMYPLISGHTGFRELAWRRGETANSHKLPSETLKTPGQIERIRRLGGMIAPILNQGDIRAWGGRVPNDAAGSSKSWAQAYLYAVEKMGGKAVGLGSDANGLNKLPAPRFGLNAGYHLHFNGGEDPVRRRLRRAQIAAQADKPNGVAYRTPILDARGYRFEGVNEDIYDPEQRQIWQALVVWTRDHPTRVVTPGPFDKLLNLAIGFGATTEAQLRATEYGPIPGSAGNAPYERRAAWLVRNERSSTGEHTEVRRLYQKIAPVWRQWQAMQGSNPPLDRSLVGRRDFEINLDGLAHYGMLPDFIQDLRNIGLTDGDLAPLFQSAEAYIETWERCLAHQPPHGHLDLVIVTADGAVSTTAWDIRAAWSPWSRIGAGVFSPGTPVAALARKPGIVDVFAVGRDGGVWSAWSATGDGWSGWLRIGAGTFPQGAPVSAVARRPEQLDLFSVGIDGRVWSAWWRAGAAWANWFPIGEATFSPGTPVTAVSRHADHLDLFAVGQDGGVWSTWWNAASGWAAWFRVGAGVFTPGTSVSVVARTPTHLDLFAVGQDGGVWSTWWNAASGWAAWFRVGTGVFGQRTPVTAVSRHADHLDLFVVGQDGGVWSTWWNAGSGWSAWFRVGAGMVAQGTRVAAVCQHPNHLDLFVVGQDGGVWSVWWDASATWSSWFRIGNVTAAPLTPVAALTS